MLRSVAARLPDHEALVDEGGRLTYREFDDEVGRIATALHQAGVRAGERVVLFVGNRIEFVLAAFGILRLGAICVPVGVRQSGAELGYVLTQCAAVGLVFEDIHAARVAAAGDAPALRWRWRIGGPPLPGEQAFADLRDPQHLPLPVQPIDEQSPAFIMYTSGTTGRPKGAVLSHLGFFHTAKNYERSFGYTSASRLALSVPISHISGLLAGLVVMLQVGGCTVIVREFKARDFLATVARERITATAMVPAMYNLCLLEPDFDRLDLSSWRVGHFGGAPMPEVSIQRLAQRLPTLRLYNGYGATETTSAATLSTAPDTVAYLDSVGTALDCVCIRVLDAQGREVAPGETGELFVLSPGNAIGYWDNAQATRSEFVSGYWRSGDIGSIDTARRVRLFDRRKDMIIRGGYKVYSTEVENVLHRLPGVIEAAVVPAPCPVLGERVHAFLHGPSRIDLQDVRNQCAQHLADYKLPDFLTLVPEPLPRNLNGKLVKQPLREEAARQARERG
jgi:long-chain acyl-CoA synthetase